MRTGKHPLPLSMTVQPSQTVWPRDKPSCEYKMLRTIFVEKLERYRALRWGAARRLTARYKEENYDYTPFDGSLRARFSRCCSISRVIPKVVGTILLSYESKPEEDIACE
jgi:hypothetical protein